MIKIIIVYVVAGGSVTLGNFIHMASKRIVAHHFIHSISVLGITGKGRERERQKQQTISNENSKAKRTRKREGERRKSTIINRRRKSTGKPKPREWERASTEEGERLLKDPMRIFREKGSRKEPRK